MEGDEDKCQINTKDIFKNLRLEHHLVEQCCLHGTLIHFVESNSTILIKKINLNEARQRGRRNEKKKRKERKKEKKKERKCSRIDLIALDRAGW